MLLFVSVFLSRLFRFYLREPRRLKLVLGGKGRLSETQALGCSGGAAASCVWPAVWEDVTRPAVVCPSE